MEDPSATSRTVTYATFCDAYVPGTKVTSSKIRELFEEDVKGATKSGKDMGIWHLHALSSILGVRVKSVYPGLGPICKDLHRLLLTRNLCFDNTIHVMWTSVSNTNQSTWWQPNYFVPLLPRDVRTLLPVQCSKPEGETEQRQEDSSAVILVGEMENAEEQMQGVDTTDMPQHKKQTEGVDTTVQEEEQIEGVDTNGM